MIPGISTHVFFDQRLHPGHLDALAASGARTIEVFAAPHHFDYTDQQAVREVASWFRSNDVRAVLHAPIYTSDSRRAVAHLEPAEWSRHVAANLNLISSRKSARITAMDEVKRGLEAAEMIPFTAAVVHLGVKGTPWDEEIVDHSISAIEHLKAFAGPLGLRLLLENLQSDATTPEHLVYILQTGHFDNVGVCLDLGHLHLMQSAADRTPDSGLAKAVATLGPRLGQLHLHDNHGPFAQFSSPDMHDEHLWPGEDAPDGDGSALTSTANAERIHWPSVVSTLATLPAAIPAVLEPVSNRQLPLDKITQRAAEAFRLLEAPQPA